MSRKVAFGSLAKEAFVIFAGVVIALAADDWREESRDRAEAEVSLRVILDDLRRDSTTVQAAQLSSDLHIEATRLLFGWRDVRQPPADSVGSALAALERSARPEFSRAGYEGLRASNRMGLVGSADLRSALLAYYEVDQPQTASYSEVVYGRREAMLEALAPMIDYATPPPGPSTVSLSVSWDVLVRTPGVMTQLRRYGGSSGGLLFQLDELEQSLIALIVRVESELGDGE